MKNEKEESSQDQPIPPLRSGKYEDVMRWMQELFFSRGLISKDQLMKTPKIKKDSTKDSTIEVMFIKRSRKK